MNDEEEVVDPTTKAHRELVAALWDSQPTDDHIAAATAWVTHDPAAENLNDDERVVAITAAAHGLASGGAQRDEAREALRELGERGDLDCIVDPPCNGCHRCRARAALHGETDD